MTAGVWLVGGAAPDGRNELRHSLRSVAANAPVIDDVWLLGDPPAWAGGCRTLRVPPQVEKFANMRAQLEAFVNHPEAPAEFYLFNDDHWVIEPVAGHLPVCHLGPTSRYLDLLLGPGVRRTGNTATKALRDTAAWLEAQGHGDVLAYYAHTPLRFHTARFAELLAAYPSGQRLEPFLLYAAAGIGPVGVDAGNAKVKTGDNLTAKLAQPMPYLSGNDETWAGPAGDHIRGLFPDPCRFEARVEVLG